MKKFLDEIKNRILLYDGSKGYLLQKAGLGTDECSEMWNIRHPEEVKKIYKEYKDAGCDVIQTNTFPGNRVHLGKYSAGDKTYLLNYQGAKLAREVMGDGFVAASIGPTGLLFEPSGELTFDKAYDIFREQVKAVADGGADIINFETFTDVAELRAALLAAKEVCNLPVICSLSFEKNNRTLMGTDPFTAGMILKAAGADMIGTNCSFGAEKMAEVVEALSDVDGVYLSVKPNAGMPEIIDGRTVYKETAESFAAFGKMFARNRARLIGGCCGTTPEFIRALKRELEGEKPSEKAGRNYTVIASAAKYVKVTEEPIKNIGTIDFDTQEDLKKAVYAGSFEELEDYALDMAAEGHDAITIKMDSEISRPEFFAEAVNKIQGYIRVPLIIRSGDPAALEKTLRLYTGIAGVITNGNNELEAMAKKYGAIVMKPDMIAL